MSKHRSGWLKRVTLLGLNADLVCFLALAIVKVETSITYQSPNTNGLFISPFFLKV